MTLQQVDILVNEVDKCIMSKGRSESKDPPALKQI